MDFGGLEETDLYGNMIRFCLSPVGLGLTEGTTFHPFAYDWRRDNIFSANQLAERIRNLDPTNNKRVYLIAHSMGGLVSRIMLNNASDISARTRLLFQISSPLEGSPKAFFTLNKHPEFSTLLDRYYLSGSWFSAKRHAQLLTTVQSFSSLFQLLPPRHVNVLIGPDNTEYPAVHPEAWPLQFHGQLDRANAAQPLLDVPPSIPIRGVYAEGHATDSQFVVNRDWTIIRRLRRNHGDATVLASSALARTIAENHIAITNGSTDHVALCGNPDVHALLKEAIQ